MQETETNGVSDEPVYGGWVDDDPSMVREFSAEIDRLQAEAKAEPKHSPQQYEVACAFLTRGRGLARLGKFELAERQRKAAKRVLGEVGEDD